MAPSAILPLRTDVERRGLKGSLSAPGGARKTRTAAIRSGEVCDADWGLAGRPSRVRCAALSVLPRPAGRTRGLCAGPAPRRWGHSRQAPPREQPSRRIDVTIARMRQRTVPSSRTAAGTVSAQALRAQSAQQSSLLRYFHRLSRFRYGLRLWQLRPHSRIGNLLRYGDGF
jgi:hypothetical protein